MKYKFLYLLFALACTQINVLALDSLRLEMKNGKKFIIHQVEPKETLFGISRRYGTKVADIMKVNPNLADGLKVNQEIMIPLIKQEKTPEKSYLGNEQFHVIQAGETLYSISKQYDLGIDSLKLLNKLSNNNLSLGDSLIIGYKKEVVVKKIEEKIVELEVDTLDVQAIETNTKEDSSKHIVQAKETLFSISKKYNVTVDQIKTLNKLTNENLSPGQVLVVPKIEEKIAEKDSVQQEEKVKLDTIYLSTNNKRFQERTELMGNLEKTVQEGFAMKIHHTENSRKYLALHRSAEIGTIIEVKNQMNGLSIFARVVGKLPETGINENVLIRVSNAAFEKLRAIDARIPVEIGYVKEND